MEANTIMIMAGGGAFVGIPLGWVLRDTWATVRRIERKIDKHDSRVSVIAESMERDREDERDMHRAIMEIRDYARDLSRTQTNQEEILRRLVDKS